MGRADACPHHNRYGLSFYIKLSHKYSRSGELRGNPDRPSIGNQ